MQGGSKTLYTSPYEHSLSLQCLSACASAPPQFASFPTANVTLSWASLLFFFLSSPSSLLCPSLSCPRPIQSFSSAPCPGPCSAVSWPAPARAAALVPFFSRPCAASLSSSTFDLTPLPIPTDSSPPNESQPFRRHACRRRLGRRLRRWPEEASCLVQHGRQPRPARRSQEAGQEGALPTSPSLALPANRSIDPDMPSHTN